MGNPDTSPGSWYHNAIDSLRKDKKEGEREKKNAMGKESESNLRNLSLQIKCIFSMMFKKSRKCLKNMLPNNLCQMFVW